MPTGLPLDASCAFAVQLMLSLYFVGHPMHEAELPNDPVERALGLQELLVSHATGGKESDPIYRLLRREFMDRQDTCELLPSFVRTCRTLGMFWAWIKGQFDSWAPRRAAIRAAFVPLLDHLEGRNRSPSDRTISEALETFDEAGVHKAWEKALVRRATDADGAITAARTLLETVCKRILDEHQKSYEEAEDLPKLYHAAAETLSLAPNQHTEQVFKSILGSCQNIVNGLGTLRNKIGDAHGKGGRPVKPSARHAALAVNLAGAMATFLVQTHNERRPQAANTLRS
jgi:hypothetical protein